MSKKKIVKSKPVIRKTKNIFLVFKRVFLLLFAITILTFNLNVKVSVRAQDADQSITTENLLKAHNTYRKELGLNELKLNTRLNISAKFKGDAMIKSQCWSHYCPSGKSPWDFFDEAAYDYVYAGENLAEGFYSMDSLMQAWLNSKTHRDNIIKEEFTEVGFSVIYGDYLNNPNNLLVVVHLGSQGENGSVLSDYNPLIEITSPTNGSTVNEPFIDVSGIINGLDNVRVFRNNVYKGNASVAGGVFTYRMDNLSSGQNIIWADASQGDLTINSNRITVNYVDSSESEFQLVSSTDEFVITQEQKNLINLIFIGFLSLIFIIDIVIVARSKVVNSKSSYSHFHLGLLVMLGLIILVGGIAGQIQEGIAV